MDEDEVAGIDMLMLIFRMLSLAADFAVAYFVVHEEELKACIGTVGQILAWAIAIVAAGMNVWWYFLKRTNADPVVNVSGNRRGIRPAHDERAQSNWSLEKKRRKAIADLIVDDVPSVLVFGILLANSCFSGQDETNKELAILIFDGVVCAANFYYLYDILKKQTVFVRDGGDPIGRVV